jgi:hypothetical protein
MVLLFLLISMESSSKCIPISLFPLRTQGLHPLSPGLTLHTCISCPRHLDPSIYTSSTRDPNKIEEDTSGICVLKCTRVHVRTHTHSHSGAKNPEHDLSCTCFSMARSLALSPDDSVRRPRAVSSLMSPNPIFPNPCQSVEA